MPGRARQFTGEERDQETGLDYFGARYFSAALGRFTSPDPMNAGADPTNPQSWNGYAYVRNSPMNAVDPSGLCTFDDDGNPVDDEDGVCVAGGSGGSVDVNGGEPDPVDPIPTFPVFTLAPIGSPSGPTNVSAYTFSVTGTGLLPPKTGTKQTFNQCMAAHANDFSIAGTLNHTYNAITGSNSLAFQNNFFAQAVLGNPLTTLAYGSATDNAGTAASLAPTIVQMGMGTVTSYGRRTTTIMALNLAGKGGVPLALGAASAGTKAAIGRVANVAGGFMSLEVSLAVNVGFTAAEAAYCASQP